MMMAQNMLTPLCFRFAVTESKSSERFSTPVSLTIMELVKFVLSFLLIAIEEGFSIPKAVAVFHVEVLKKPQDTLALAVPAVLYAIQNACLQWAGGNLPAALFQVTYQGKMLIVAIFSVLLLQKQLLRVQWLAIWLMGVGIGLVQVSDSKESKQDDMANRDEQSVPLGMVYLLTATLCSGFASVYFERIVKQGGASKSQGNGKKASVWVQNAQLAGFTVVINSCGVASERLLSSTTGLGEDWGYKPLLHGFRTSTWLMIINNALGGLIVALVIKHADNILRGFATALSTICVTLASVVLFGFTVKPIFGVGTVMVIASTFLYGSIVKLPGSWWNAESDTCARLRKNYQQNGSPAITSKNAPELEATNGHAKENGVELPTKASPASPKAGN